MLVAGRAAALICLSFAVWILPTAGANGTAGGNRPANSSASTNGTDDTNGTNGTNGTKVRICTVKDRLCCGTEVRAEAALACREYLALRVEEERCGLWQDYLEDSCRESCANCTVMGKVIYDQCLFALQPLMPYNAAVRFCLSSRSTWETARCPSACVDKDAYCQTDTWKTCNLQCGNFYKGCSCYRQRSMMGGQDVCEGKTVLEGQDSGCDLTPQTCKNFWPGTECGLYKYCPVDLCVVKNVQCPRLDTCQTESVCNPVDARCYSDTLPDDAQCDDGLFYTHSDKCSAGVCRGVEDKCLRYAVNCTTTGPCLQPSARVPGACDRTTGTCIFEARPDGTPCSSTAGQAAAAGYCQAGLCRRQDPAVCAAVKCPAPDQCQEQVACDGIKGTGCVTVPKPEGTICDDGRGDTQGDQCIEGRCVGDPLGLHSQFQYLGEGACPDRATGLSAAVPRYYADVPAATDCEAQCQADPECKAYSFGFHVCSIYGSTRSRDPDASRWGRQWVLELPLAGSPVEVRHAVSCYLKVRAGTLVVAAQASRANLMAATLAVLIAVPASWLLAMYRRDLVESFRSLTSEEADEVWDGASSESSTPKAVETGATLIFPALDGGLGTGLSSLAGGGVPKQAVAIAVDATDASRVSALGRAEGLGPGLVGQCPESTRASVSSIDGAPQADSTLLRDPRGEVEPTIASSTFQAENS